MEDLGSSGGAGAGRFAARACSLGLLAGCGAGAGASSSAPATTATSSLAHVSDTAEMVSATIPVAPPAAKLPLSGRVITVDPGHNGGNFTHPQQIARLVNDGNGEKECDTTGTAAPDGYREADFNWSVALA